GVLMTVKVVLGQIKFYTALVAILHSPGIIPRGLAVEANGTAENLKAARDMKTAIEDLGFFVSKENASKIVIELIRAPDSKQFLTEFAEATEAFGKAMEELSKAYEEW